MSVKIDTSASGGPFYMLKANGIVIRIGISPQNQTRMKVYLENSSVETEAAARTLIQQMFDAELATAEIEIES